MDFVQHRTVIHLPAGNCTDMTGAITTITRADPLVHQIVTVCDGLPDTTYMLCEDGEWRAARPVPFVWQPRPVLMRPGAAELRVA